MKQLKTDLLPFILFLVLILAAFIAFWSVADVVILGASLAVVLIPLHRLISEHTIPEISAAIIRAGQVRKQEKRLHTEALEELSEGFDDDVKPMVVEIQGTQHRLTGTAEAQYDEWRGLLRQIYINESGFVPEDVAIYAEPALEAPVELPPVPEAVPAGVVPVEAAPEGAVPAEGAEVAPQADAADASAAPVDGA